MSRLRITTNRLRFAVDVELEYFSIGGGSSTKGSVVFGLDDTGQVRVEGLELVRLIESMPEAQREATYHEVGNQAAAALAVLAAGFADEAARQRPHQLPPWHEQLHKLWTKATSLPGYEKQEWLQLERLIDAATAAAKRREACTG